MRKYIWKPIIIVMLSMLLTTLQIGLVRSSNESMLKEEGGYWYLSNGLLEVKVNYLAPLILSVSEPNEGNLLSGSFGWLYANTRTSTAAHDTILTAMQSARPLVVQVWRNDDQMVDVSMIGIMRSVDVVPLVFDWHIVMLRGTSGFYSYVILRHSDGMPPAVLEQFVISLQTNPLYFDRYYMDEKRQGEIVFDGFINGEARKYVLGAREIGLNPFHGLYGENGPYSLWNVYPSYEYYQSLDKKYILIEDNARGAYLHSFYYSLHYLGVGALKVIDGDWQEVYGPNLFYLAKGDSKETCLQQVQERVRIEQEKWPYHWITDSWTGLIGRVVDESGQPLKSGTRIGEIVISTDEEEVKTYIESNGWFLTVLPSGGRYQVYVREHEEPMCTLEIDDGQLRWIELTLTR